MSKKILLPLLVLLFAPLAVQASCESVVQEIKEKIMNNGVPEDGFKLETVLSENASQAGGQVVGNCDNESYQIIYTRFTNGGNTDNQ